MAMTDSEKLLLDLMARVHERNLRAVLLQNYIATCGPLSEEAGQKAKELLK